MWKRRKSGAKKEIPLLGHTISREKHFSNVSVKI
jgi:hypothetical protein